MNILQTLGEMVGYKKYIDGYSTKIRRKCMDIDGYSTKIRRDGWI